MYTLCVIYETVYGSPGDTDTKMARSKLIEIKCLRLNIESVT